MLVVKIIGNELIWMGKKDSKNDSFLKKLNDANREEGKSRKKWISTDIHIF